MAKQKTQYVCQECGYKSPKWLGKCTECGSWDSFVEEFDVKKKNISKGVSTGMKPQLLKHVTLELEDRFVTGIGELDLVLGGGVVKGSLVLIGGDPGIGKSTILLQVAKSMASQRLKVLYVSGEESLKQTKLRADRLSMGEADVYLVSENNMGIITKYIEDLQPDLLIVDSIQTVYNPEVTSAPGSVSQVREATNTLMNISKGKGISTFIVGHVTKSGSIAGPKVLEHMVDTVLYFEGERHNVFRILRAVKNRFGSTNEIGIFEMTNRGLEEVKNPSQIFLSNRPMNAAGSVVTASMEGTRPVLVEIQSLISQTNFNMPRRMAIGLDYNKMIMLMAVLEKKVGMQLYNQDGYINVVGGMTLSEPAIDLALIASIASSFRNALIPADTIIFGEVGLTGEVRSVNHAQSRINEASKMGFKKVILPKGNIEKLTYSKDVKVIGVEDVESAFLHLFGR